MRALRTAFFLAVPIAIVVACGGTTKTKGQLMVSVQTDMAMPKDIDTVGLYVLSDGATFFGNSFHVGTDVKLPATIGIVEGSTPGARVVIRLTARRNSKLLVLSEVTTTVPDGRLALLRMPIQWLCTGQATDGADQDPSTRDQEATSTCSGTAQCVAGECVDETVDSSKLPDFDAKLVFGGAPAPDQNGTCLDTLGCFASGFLAAVDTTDCTIPKPSGGAGLNVALEQPAGGAGICGPEACLVPLDQASDGFGWSDLGNGRLQLPKGVCDQLTKKMFLGVAVTTSCATKTEAVPTCGPWNSSSNNLGTLDAGAPSGSSDDAGVIGELDGSTGAPDDAGSDGVPDAALHDGGASSCTAFTGMNESVCDPVAQTGCSKGSMCVATTSSGATACAPVGGEGAGQPCSLDASAVALECASGLYCLSGSCTRYCCSAADCADAGGLGQCAQQKAQGSAFFGVCE